MTRICMLFCLFISLQLFAQDTTMNNLLKDMNKETVEARQPVKIFNSSRAIITNTTEVVGKGKMDFIVTHNFGDITSKGSGLKTFFGLDNTFDVRIGFDIGLSNRLNLNIARSKGDEQRLLGDSVSAKRDNVLRRMYEIALKYVLCRQLENDPSHPIAITLYFNNVICAMTDDNANTNKPNTFGDFGDRMSRVFQVIFAKKIGKVSLQLSPILVNYGYVPTYDSKNTFALATAIRLPVSRMFAIVVDWTHPFHSDTKKTNYRVNQGVKFRDPLGIGVEVTTAGHIFHMNFNNSTAIMENQFIPYTTSSWGKGQFRWGFTISRTFVLWREK